MSAILPWLQRNKIWLHPALEVREDEGELSIWLREEWQYVPLRTVVGIIPKTSCLSIRTSALSPSIDRDALLRPESSCGLLLALCLLHEHGIGERSKWQGYISSLPRERGEGKLGLSLPLEWSSQSVEAQWCTQTEAGRILQRAERRPYLPSSASRGVSKRHLQQFFESEGSITLSRAGTQADLDTFIGAYSLVSSRGFVCDLFHGLVLAPLADLFNHSDYNQVQFEVDDIVCDECGALGACEHYNEPEERAMPQAMEDPIEMTLRAPVYAGLERTEVFNSYGSLSNARLLTCYGFAMEENECDRYCWDWHEATERHEIWSAFGISDDAVLQAQWAEMYAGRSDDLAGQFLELDDASGPTPLSIPSLSPFGVVLRDQVPPSGLQSILAWPTDDSDLERDSEWPLFVDGDGRISYSLWRAAVVAAVVRQKWASGSVIEALPNTDQALLGFSRCMEDTVKSDDKQCEPNATVALALGYLSQLIKERQWSERRNEEALLLLQEEGQRSGRRKSSLYHTLLAGVGEQCALRVARDNVDAMRYLASAGSNLSE